MRLSEATVGSLHEAGNDNVVSTIGGAQSFEAKTKRWLLDEHVKNVTVIQEYVQELVIQGTLNPWNALEQSRWAVAPRIALQLCLCSDWNATKGRTQSPPIGVNE